MNLEEFITPFYFFNGLLVLVYPYLRLRGVSSFGLVAPDIWWGHSREITIIVTFILFAFARYKKYCTPHHAASSILFALKAMTCCLLFFIDFRLSIIYLVTCLRSLPSLVVFIIFRFPVKRGLHYFKKIESEDDFEKLIIAPGLKRGKETSSESFQDMEMAFVEFWAPFAETARYVGFFDSRLDQSGQSTLANTRQTDSTSLKVATPHQSTPTATKNSPRSTG